jgi:D-glycero-D-manno-heptose 1,7-bisphosphate phosphatase
MSHRAVFLDRDGTIARDVHYCRDPRDFEVLPRVPAAIRTLNEHGYKVVVITNQSGIARGYFTLETLSLIHEKMAAELARDNAFVDAIYLCPHHPDEECVCRKPKPALLLQAARDIGIALDRSYMIGDDIKDVQAGNAAGCRTVWLRPVAVDCTDGRADAADQGGRHSAASHHVAADLFEAVEWLLTDA